MFAVPHEVLLRLQRGTSDRAFNTPFSALPALVLGKLSAESVRVRGLRQHLGPLGQVSVMVARREAGLTACAVWLPSVSSLVNTPALPAEASGFAPVGAYG